ncbi:hypothetical protein DSY14_06470 [Nocardiopsis sp. MG754419]|nr:hypothetical protein [Nocardiopsis sp. MG754419]
MVCGTEVPPVGARVGPASPMVARRSSRDAPWCSAAGRRRPSRREAVAALGAENRVHGFPGGAVHERPVADHRVPPPLTSVPVGLAHEPHTEGSP